MLRLSETAKLYRIGEYKRIGPNEPVPEDPKKRNAQLGLNPAHVKAAVADGSPVILGIEIFPSFEAQLAVDSGFISVPHQAEIQGSPMSGHAVLVVGYRDALNSFLIRNSWGAGWGVGGYGWLPYQYVTPPLCLKTEPDCWTFILDEANEGSLSSALVK